MGIKKSLLLFVNNIVNNIVAPLYASDCNAYRRY